MPPAKRRKQNKRPKTTPPDVQPESEAAPRSAARQASAAVAELHSNSQYRDMLRGLIKEQLAEAQGTRVGQPVAPVDQGAQHGHVPGLPVAHGVDFLLGAQLGQAPGTSRDIAGAPAKECLRGTQHGQVFGTG